MVGGNLLHLLNTHIDTYPPFSSAAVSFSLVFSVIYYVWVAVGGGTLSFSYLGFLFESHCAVKVAAVFFSFSFLDCLLLLAQRFLIWDFCFRETERKQVNK